MGLSLDGWEYGDISYTGEGYDHRIFSSADVIWLEPNIFESCYLEITEREREDFLGGVAI